MARTPVRIIPKDSVAKLEALGFDPVEELIKFHDQLDIDIANLLYDEDGEPRPRYSAQAYSSLIATKKACIDSLLRYGYARVTESVEVKTPNIKPVIIKLAKRAEDFNIEDGDGEKPYSLELQGIAKK